MDTPGAYIGGSYKRYISPKDVEKMKNNMKKVPIIKSKSDRYHLKEEQEAEDLINKLNNNYKK